MKVKLRLVFILFSWCKVCDCQSTIFDIAQTYSASSQYPGNLDVAQRLHKLQPRVSDNIPFPCNVSSFRSKKRPKSAHALRPGDISVVGAIGDSILTGNGLVATNMFEIAVENKGMSFAIGGLGTWRQFLTVPNILKEFNPRLVGYSLKDGFLFSREDSQLNAAIPAGYSGDMPQVTRTLIKKMNDHPKVDVAKDWKMVFFLVGANNFCSQMCYNSNPEVVVENHRRDLIKVLRTLRDNLPRTIVNVIVTPSFRPFVNTTTPNKPSLCYFTQSIFCTCLTSFQFQHLQGKFDEIMAKWQQVELDVVNDPQFDRDDFTVVAQPFMLNYSFHRTANGLTDYSDMSIDCFHMSQKEAARAALSLWNNILEPVGKKNTSPSELFNFKCPSVKHPFIFTRRNSL